MILRHKAPTLSRNSTSLCHEIRGQSTLVARTKWTWVLPEAQLGSPLGQEQNLKHVSGFKRHTRRVQRVRGVDEDIRAVSLCELRSLRELRSLTRILRQCGPTSFLPGFCGSQWGAWTPKGMRPCPSPIRQPSGGTPWTWRPGWQRAEFHVIAGQLRDLSASV